MRSGFVIVGGNQLRIAPQIVLNEEQRSKLLSYARGRSVAHRLVERATIILLAAEGKENLEIAEALQISRHTVARWRQRFLNLGVEGLEKDAPRPGRSRTLDVEEIIRKTTQEKAPNSTHWSTRTMARAVGVSEASVRRAWRAHGLKPHLIETFKVSNDPEFASKLEDIVGLYLHPPQHAIVLSVDEKSQIQALDRTQPGLPMKKGRGQTMTHDYKRHGTTTLFAALNTLDGSVLSQCRDRHTNEDWIAFLRLIHRQTPKDKQVHVIADNYAAHKHPNVQRWLERHKRFHIHYTPTSASWLNMVERFFRDITQNRIRRGVFRSVPELVNAINDYVQQHNRDPKPFIWTAKAGDILQKVTRAKRVLIDKAQSE
jgi:transposase